MGDRMLSVNGFSDLCIPYTSDRKVLVDMVKQLIECELRFRLNILF